MVIFGRGTNDKTRATEVMASSASALFQAWNKLWNFYPKCLMPGWLLQGGFICCNTLQCFILHYFFKILQNKLGIFLPNQRKLAALQSFHTSLCIQQNCPLNIKNRYSRLEPSLSNHWLFRFRLQISNWKSILALILSIQRIEHLELPKIKNMFYKYNYLHKKIKKIYLRLSKW